MITPIRRPAGLPIRCPSDLEQVVEPPLREAVWRLVQGGIQTVYSSAHATGRTQAQLWLRLPDGYICSEALPPHRSIEIEGEEYLIFLYPLTESTTCEEIYRWSVELAELILNQVERCSSAAS